MTVSKRVYVLWHKWRIPFRNGRLLAHWKVGGCAPEVGRKRRRRPEWVPLVVPLVAGAQCQYFGSRNRFRLGGWSTKFAVGPSLKTRTVVPGTGRIGSSAGSMSLWMMMTQDDADSTNCCSAPISANRATVYDALSAGSFQQLPSRNRLNAAVDGSTWYWPRHSVDFHLFNRWKKVQISIVELTHEWPTKSNRSKFLPRAARQISRYFNVLIQQVKFPTQ